MSISQTVSRYVAGLNAFKEGKPYKIDNITYSVKFDPNSYNEVLIFLTEQDGKKSVQFAGTDFGIYIREEGTKEAQHYFYHTLMYTSDFGLNLNDLANVHYIFKEMKKS